MTTQDQLVRIRQARVIGLEHSLDWIRERTMAKIWKVAEKMLPLEEESINLQLEIESRVEKARTGGTATREHKRELNKTLRARLFRVQWLLDKLNTEGVQLGRHWGGVYQTILEELDIAKGDYEVAVRGGRGTVPRRKG